MDRDASIKRARRSRRNPTATERAVWERLRQRRLAGLRFRRQMPLGPYVLDFVCLRHPLIIEADGPFHDPVRDAWLRAKGFRVLRFSNRELLGSPDAVADRILSALDELPPIPTI